MRPNYKKRGDIMQKNNNRFNRVEEEMKKAASELDFERAMELRDIIFEMKVS